MLPGWPCDHTGVTCLAVYKEGDSWVAKNVTSKGSGPAATDLVPACQELFGQARGRAARWPRLSSTRAEAGSLHRPSARGEVPPRRASGRLRSSTRVAGGEVNARNESPFSTRVEGTLRDGG